MTEKIIQLLSHNGELLALSNKGTVYVWEKILKNYESFWFETYFSLEESKQYEAFCCEDIKKTNPSPLRIHDDE
jgi:hypothetical protein